MIPRSKIDATPSKIWHYKTKGWSVENIANYYNVTKDYIVQTLKSVNMGPFNYEAEAVKKFVLDSSIEKHTISLMEKYTKAEENYKFKCECGEEFNRSISSFRSTVKYYNGVFPCPSVAPYGEFLIENFLKENKIKNEKEIAQFKTRRGGYVRFDFKIEVNGIKAFIEHDGEYHENTNDETVAKRDKAKDKYCAKNNIPLLRLKGYKNLGCKIEDFIDNKL